VDLAHARELLLLHSTGHPDVHHPTWERGFLGSLRPYRGLREANLHEVMAALVALAPELRRERVDREVVAALWGICMLARLCGLHPDGMLRRNGLISDEDVARLDAWVQAIQWAVSMLLGTTDGPDAPLDEALAGYRQLTGRDRPPEPDPWPAPKPGQRPS
jgi:hypothetical protein